MAKLPEIERMSWRGFMVSLFFEPFDGEGDGGGCRETRFAMPTFFPTTSSVPFPYSSSHSMISRATSSTDLPVVSMRCQWCLRQSSST